MGYPIPKRNNAEDPLRVLLISGAAGTGLPDIVLELNDYRVGPMIQQVISEAGFIEGLVSFRPDVILSDLEFEQFSPQRALEVMRAAGYSTPLIVVSPSFDEQSAVECLRAGAEDLILRGNLGRLRPAIEEALAQREPLSRLSPRQREVMRLVAMGYTMREIAERLGLSVKTVETHRSEVVKRLGIRDVASLVRYALRVGLIPATPSAEAARTRSLNEVSPESRSRFATK